ncbi:MAG: ABC transporter ATP-binding protein [Defluviitaleaceae bacterium]|nr:ABC transporter ATP-binding protein [Defluviitaleaceae bacterium]
MISINNVSKFYKKKLKKTYVFKDFSLEFQGPGVIGLLGENGVGKTTLLKMIANLSSPLKGSIEIDGTKVSRHTRDRVSYLISPEHISEFVKIRQIIDYFRDFFADFNDKKCEELIKTFNIDVENKISSLSKGYKERVCLMLCLSRNADYYILDEPMAGFDPKFKKDIVTALLSHVEPSQTIIISTHLLKDLENLFDTVIVLKKNKAVVKTAEEIRESGISIENYYLEVVNDENFG